MFGTFRYNKQTRDHDHVELLTANGVEARGYTAIACDYCRARKLKCSGNKSGCDRCIEASVTCTYRQDSSARRERKQDRRQSSLQDELTSQYWSSNLDSHQSSARPPSQAQRGQQQQAQRQKEQQRRAPAPAASQTRPSPGPAGDSSTAVSGPIPDTIVMSPSNGSFPSWEVLSNDYFSNAADDEGSGLDGLTNLPMAFSECVEENDNLGAEPAHEGAPAPEWAASSSAGTEQTSLKSTGEPLLYTSMEMDPHDEQASAQMSDGTIRETGSGAIAVYGRTAPRYSLAGNEFSPTCHCLSAMAHFLETMGARSVAAAGTDDLLVCLGRGIETCVKVLACPNCNACADNGMLLATLAQQLGSVAKGMADKLLSNVSKNAHDIRGNAPSDISVWFGRYMIEPPEIRLRLGFNAVLLHLTRLQNLLNNIKDGVRPNSVAWKQIVATADNVANVFYVVKQQLENQARAG